MRIGTVCYREENLGNSVYSEDAINQISDSLLNKPVTLNSDSSKIVGNVVAIKKADNTLIVEMKVDEQICKDVFKKIGGGYA